MCPITTSSNDNVEGYQMQFKNSAVNCLILRVAQVNIKPKKESSKSDMKQFFGQWVDFRKSGWCEYQLNTKGLINRHSSSH